MSSNLTPEWVPFYFLTLGDWEFLHPEVVCEKITVLIYCDLGKVGIYILLQYRFDYKRYREK